ncbi:MAG: penicillin acylase family protein [Candidatus Dormiibacterota bacterium]
MIIALIVAAAVLVAVCVALLVARHRTFGVSLPRVRGRLGFPGLMVEVTVGRDRWGVPHVIATSMEDAAFAMGVVHAQDRLWQMEVTRRVATGRISELIGAEGVNIDRFIRRVGLQRVAREEELRLGPEARRMLKAYAAGVNGIAQSGRALPIEYRLLGVTPEPWEPMHSLAALKLLALGLSMNWDTELQRLELLRAIGPEHAARLDIVYPDANPTVLATTVRVAGADTRSQLLNMFREAARWIPTAGGMSNAWVVSGERTTSGRPILCNDPHLVPGMPSIWYATHVQAGDDFEATGVTMPGMPFVIIGHNTRVAWGFTNSFADCQDLVIEEFDTPAADKFRTERGFEPTRRLREIIHVKNSSDVLEEVVVTRHGPVVERIEDPERGIWRGLALQWTALQPGGAAEGLLRLQRAEDWKSFKEAFTTFDAPSQNVVYADVDGHIGYLLSGRIPVRRTKPSGLPVQGWTGNAVWTRYLTIDEVPQIFDPPEHQIITANNRITGDNFPFYIGADYMSGYRALRIGELLGERVVDLPYMARAQMDLVCPPARQVVRLLGRIQCANPTAESARQRLAQWDAVMDPGRTEPTLYEAFMARLAEHSLSPICGNAWRILAGVDLSHPVFQYPGNIVGRLTPSLIERWELGDDGLFEGLTTWAEVISRSLDDAMTDLRGRLGRNPRGWRWGRVHRLELIHAFGRRRGLARFFNAPSIRVGGNTDTVLATSLVPGEPFATRLSAPSWRQVIDVGNWDASGGIHLPGQSGQPGSRHYRDLSRRWRTNRQFPLYWSPQEVRRHARTRLILYPVPPARAGEPGGRT